MKRQDSEIPADLLFLYMYIMLQNKLGALTWDRPSGKSQKKKSNFTGFSEANSQKNGDCLPMQ